MMKNEKLNTILRCVCAVGLVFFIVAAARRLNIYRVSGESMSPTIKNGDIVHFSTVSDSDISRNDIILYYHGKFLGSKKTVVKRVIAVAGDEISFLDGQIYVNGVPISMNGIMDNGGVLSTANLIVGKNSLFCIGDNYNNSEDCRVYGVISTSDVIGRVDKIIE